MFKMLNNERVFRAVSAIFLALIYSVGISVIGIVVISIYAEQTWGFSLIGILSAWIITGIVLVHRYGSSDIYTIEDSKLTRQAAEDSATLTTLVLTVLFGWPGFWTGVFYGVLVLGSACWSRELTRLYYKLALVKEDRGELMALIK